MLRLRPLEERYWEHVIYDPGSGCWLWDGEKSQAGYGYIRAGGRGSKRIPAHHLALTFHGVEIEPFMFVCHHRDIPNGVNPEHLFLGTPSDNTQDMMAKGRNGYGSFNKTKTHCKYGHLLSGDNLYVSPAGVRQCRTCLRRRGKQTRERRKQKEQRQ